MEPVVKKRNGFGLGNTKGSMERGVLDMNIPDAAGFEGPGAAALEGDLVVRG